MPGTDTSEAFSRVFQIKLNNINKFVVIFLSYLLTKVITYQFTNVLLQNVRKQSLYQDVFCRDGGRLRASLQGIRETIKYRIRIKGKDSRGLTR